MRIQLSGINIRGRVRAILRDVLTNEIKQITPWESNLITDAGLAAVARRIINEAAVANEGMITYGAVGKGTATIAVTDTLMEDEVARKALATGTAAANVVTISVYFTSAEANDTLTRFALFGEDASASADTGTMFEHYVFKAAVTKTSNETLTIQVEITLT